MGVRRDAGEAAAWFQRAAEQDYERAQYQLGMLYLQVNGVEESLSEAVAWIRRAAEAGLDAAQVLPAHGPQP